MSHNFYLLKRSPEFTSNGVIVKRSISEKEFSENSINKKPPSVKLQKGDEIFVSETSYGIYAHGFVVSLHPLIEFSTLENLITYHTDNGLKDDRYWFKMAKKLSRANIERPSKIFYQSFTVNLSLLENVRPLIGDLHHLAKVQNSLTKLDEGDANLIRNYTTETLTKLDGKIPGHLRLDLYSMFNKKAGLGTWIDVDHFVPRSIGGPGNISENLVPVGFSINRYKGNAIPKGLFLVANNFDSLSRFICKVFLTSTSDFLKTADAKEAARKICNVVNSWSISDAKKFYLEVMKYHHPDYYSMLSDRDKYVT